MTQRWRRTLSAVLVAGATATVGIAQGQIAHVGSSQNSATGITYVGASSTTGGSSGITFVGSNSASSNGTTLVIAFPGGSAVDDVVVAQVAVRGNSSTLPTPAGWTKIAGDTSEGGGPTELRHAAYSRVLTAGDVTAGSVTFSFGGSRTSVGGLSVFRGVDTADPVEDASADSQGSNDNEINADSVTTAVANSRVVALYAAGGSFAFTPPGGYTERYEQPNGSSVEVMAADTNQASAGATGDEEADISANSNRRSGILVALNPGTPGITIPHPAGLAVGDLMIAQIAKRGGTYEPVFGAPAGWTLLNTAVHIPTTGTGGNSHKNRAYYRVATAGDVAAGSSTWTFDFAGNAVGGIVAYRGVDPADPIDDSTEAEFTDNVSTVAATGITVTGNGAMLVALYGVNGNPTFTGPTGYTQRFTQYNGNQIGIVAADQFQETAGATGTVSVSLSSNQNRRVARLVALNAAANTLVLSVPAGTAVDDVMVATVAVRPSTVSITPPGGWTSLGRTDQGSGNSNSQQQFLRVAGGSEPATYTWTLSANSGAVGGIVTYSGVDTADPVDVQGDDATASGTAHTADSVTTTVADTRVISSHSYASSGTWTTPAGMTERVDVASLPTPDAAGIALSVNDLAQAAVGATGDRTATAAGNADTGVTRMLALKPPTVAADIVVTMGGDVDNINAGSILLAGTAHGGPEQTASSENTGDDDIDTDITTLSDDAWLVDVVGAGNTGSYTPAGGQTERWDEAGDTSTGAGSTRPTTTAGSYSMEHEHTNGNRQAHFVAAFARSTAAAISFDSAFGDTVDDDDTLGWSHTVPVDFDGTLIVGITVEDPSCSGDQVVASVTHDGNPLTFIGAQQTPAAGICMRVELWYLDFGEGDVGFTCPAGTVLTEGIYGEYYNLTAPPSSPLTTATPDGTRVDGPVDFDWAGGAPGVAGIGADDFAVRWEGVLLADETGNYRFRTNSDDGVRLWVDDTLVIDNWTDHAATLDTSGNIALVAGQFYSIRLEFYENGGQAVMELYWERPSDSGFSLIPVGSMPTPDEGLYYCAVDPVIAHYPFDEEEWTGATDEVEEVTGQNNDGTALGGADTSFADPARPGSPGTCRYGVFDGNDDSVDIDDLSDLLNTTASMAFWIRTTQTGAANAWQSPGVAGFEAAGDTDDIFWGWINDDGEIGISVGDNYGDSVSSTAINDGDWHHIVLTRDASTGDVTIYVDGVLDHSGTTDSGVVTASYSEIGRIVNAEYFEGDLDEIRIYDYVVGPAEVDFAYNDTRPCDIDLLDHYAIAHGGSGVTCTSTSVTITGHTASDDAIDPGTVTIMLSTSTDLGDWTVVEVGSGILDNGTPGDGEATYEFPGGEESVTLAFNYTYIDSGDSESFYIDVWDGAVGDLGDGDPEDPELTFHRTGFRFTPNIETQIAGKPSDTGYNAQTIGLQAIRSSDEDPTVCVPAFPDPTVVDVEFGAECLNPAACAGVQLSVTNDSTTTPVATSADNAGAGAAAYTTVSLLFEADATADLAITYADVGQLQLHARHDILLENGDPSGDLMLGSSNTFVVRPFAFDVTATGNPAATSAGGGVYTTAGSPFTAGARAVVWEAGDDVDDDGIADGHDDTDPTNNADLSGNASTPNFGNEGEDVALDSHLVAPLPGGAPGALSGTTTVTSFTAGAGTTSVNFSEVGIIELTGAVDSGNYLGIGAGESDRIVGASSHVGRFTPHYFDVTVTDGCSGFTWSGQPFEVSATAHRLGGGVTTNYDGGLGFSKLLTFSDAGSTANFTNHLVAALDFVAGVVTINDIFYTFPDPATLPETLDMRAVDGDTVSSAGFLEESTEVRSGRLFVANANGSELLDLPVPFVIESYQDLGGNPFWAVETADSCTAVVTGDIDDDNYQGDLAAITVSGTNLASGEGTIDLTAPGVTGSVDITIDLDAAGSPWLKFDWLGDGVENPTGRASFGIYDGSENRIYLRELY